ncbi:hypothetical protein Sya03_48380 [Spirilliplanes yamanashiensis]|uniref:Ricin B lectin domain-containing protein n=1 Tax=Spirilliplanes yamanashiensis TaxID=42233 RepID=A0A8J4DL02_9ACTN|nr:hypothetical protein Sya03_48380 [Spirilliplanes yamanashiensis]
MTALAAAAGLVAVSPNAGWTQAGPAPRAAAPAFKVLAFYNGTWDAAHINFVREANRWFPQAAAANGFQWESTTDWSRLNAGNLAQYRVVMFLDDAPPAAQRPAFEQYMRSGGAWLGFHVTAFTTNPSAWSWYHNTFLGTGAFRSNTWGPTRVTMRVENAAHPSVRRLPATFTSAVSEWYSWSNDLRANPDIRVLGSIDPSSFPVGTDPNQTWRSGYYPIMWTNTKYRMLYANFGHNAMNYSTNQGLSSTFDSEVQNRFLIDGLLWLGGGGAEPPSAWSSVVNRGSGKCLDLRGGAAADGTAVQQSACTGGAAQQFRLTATSGGYSRVDARLDPARVLDVANVSAADNARVQLWSYGGGANQQWRAEPLGDGHHRLVNRHSGRCLDVPAASTADGVQLVQYACNGSAAQAFRLVPAA